MKKFFLIACLCGLSFAAFAQEEKDSNYVPSPEMSALQTVTGLVKYGYENYSATALAEAVKILSETQPMPLGVEVEKEGTEVADKKNNFVSYEYEQLLSDAKKFAGKDEVVIAYINQVEAGLESGGTTRGAAGGPRIDYTSVNAYGANRYYIKFVGGLEAQVYVCGDGDTDLDLYVYNSSGALVVRDEGYTDECYVRWTPRTTQTYTIRVVNRGRVYNNYMLGTN